MVYKRIISEQIKDYLLPGICFLCQGAAPGRDIVCDGCRADLPRVTASCHRCGNPLINDSICQACRDGVIYIDRILAPHQYRYPANELVRQLKYNQRLILARELGYAVVAEVKKAGAPLPECILPVPLHWFRYFTRGFNQSAEIAAVIARDFSIPVNNRLLQRTKYTVPQFGLGLAERKRNIRGAFKLKNGPAYRSVAIVDDVMTTGATVNEAARLLKKSGVKRIDVWAYARAVHTV